MSSFQHQYDLIIIGGGATGSGIALDATLRGLKAIVLEQNDFSEGTSSRSTKLVHGGVRYLENAVKHIDKEQYSLVKEGLRERYKILKNAPHIAHKITLLTPLYHWYEVPYIYAGLVLYDIISGKYRIGNSSIVSKKNTLLSNPSLKSKGLKAAVQYYDGAFNDARMTIALLQSAEEKGAIVRNYSKVQNFIYKDDKIIGVKIFDKIDNKYEILYAKSIINATGVFADNIREMAQPNIKKIMRPSSGIHIILDKKYLPSNNGLMIPKTKDGRVLFILPYLGKCLIGTTDNESKVEEHPKVLESDIKYLLKHINYYFNIKITQEDIISSFCGLRPLVDINHSESSAQLAREHIIEKLDCGLISIVGGKFTTYRSMAEETVDYVFKNVNIKQTGIKCTTHKYKLIGSRKNLKQIKEQLIKDTKKTSLINKLISFYGDRTEKIIEIANKENSYEQISIDEYDIIKAELIYTIRYEYVKKPMDFIERRRSLALIDKKGAKKILDKVLSIMKNELSWNEAKYVNEKKEALELLERAL